MYCKMQQLFSVLLGKDFHNASVHSFTLNNIFDHLRLPYFIFALSAKKIRSGTFRISHRPTWRRDSPISQSLRAECPGTGSTGGLAPGPNPFNAAAHLMQTLEPPGRPLTDL